MKKSLLGFIVAVLFSTRMEANPTLAKEVESIDKASSMKGKAFLAINPKSLFGIINASSSLDERNSAKVLLMLFYSAKSDAEMSEADKACAINLRSEIIKDAPESWQGMYAKFCSLCEKGDKTKDNEEISAIKEALSNWDFEIFEKERSPEFLVVRKIYGERPNVFRECLKSVLINRLCLMNNPDQLEEAVKVKSSITDVVFLAEAERRIENARKQIKEMERLKKSRDRATLEGKPWVGGQAPIDVLVDKEKHTSSTNKTSRDVPKKKSPLSSL